MQTVLPFYVVCRMAAYCNGLAKLVAFNLATFLNNFPTKSLATIGLFTIPLSSEIGAERKKKYAKQHYTIDSRTS